LEKRLLFFLSFHLGTNKKGFLKSESERLCPGIHFKDKWERIMAIVLESEFLVEEEEVSFDPSDVTVLLTSGAFYVDAMTTKARIFHSLPDRVSLLQKCYEDISSFYSSNGPGPHVAHEIGRLIQSTIAVPLPWSIDMVLEAVSDGAQKCFLQVFLCPLREHMGIDEGSQTGTFLTKIQSMFIQGIFKLIRIGFF